MQHVNIKIFAEKADIDLTDAVPIFHRWIQEGGKDELLIDVADYKHVPDGPGVMLIGHQAYYSLDQIEGRLGLLYNRKTAVEGDTQAALKQAFDAARAASKRLEGEAAFRDKLVFNAGDVEVIVNDRIVVPNTDESWNTYKPEIEKFFAGVYGHTDFTVTRLGEPRDRFRVGVKTGAPVRV